MVDWLASDDARSLRKSADITVVPVMDIDNVAIGIVELLLIGLVVRHARSTSRVMLSKAGIEVSQTRFFLKPTASLSADLIDEIMIGDFEQASQKALFGSRWIVVVAEDERIAFGETLSPEEAAYVRDLAKTVVSAGP